MIDSLICLLQMDKDMEVIIGNIMTLILCPYIEINCSVCKRR